MPHLLTKSDFRLARTCRTKLFYRKAGYATNTSEDEYLELLADGGYMIEALAQLLYPEGREIEPSPDPLEAARRTMLELDKPRVTLFQPTLLAAPLLARVDILRRDGDTFELIEVKAKAYDTSRTEENFEKGWEHPFITTKGTVAAGWVEYVEDLAFQEHVLRELFPHARIRAALLMPDTTKTTSIDGLFGEFSIHREPWPSGRGERSVIRFTGDADAARDDHFLTTVDATEAVELLRDDVAAAIADYAALVAPALVRAATPIALHCKKCEFHAAREGEPDGFNECWGPLGSVTPHLFELTNLGHLRADGELLANQLIARGKASLFDVPQDVLVTKKGVPGSRNRRQLLQLRHTREGTAYIDSELRRTTEAAKYPLHFIDFETSALAVPYHAGMYPYETVAFQWSCHTIPEPGATIMHADWINVDDAFPNFAFAESLRETLGEHGTVLTWHRHERNTLRAIDAQMERRDHDAPPLAFWLHRLASAPENGPEAGRLLDMHRLCEMYYFHPRMGGRTSIKAVLAAVWESSAAIRARFPEYVRHDGDRLVSPYEALPSELIQENEEEVREGTGAVRAYQRMMFGAERNDPAFREKWKELLRRYCKLDTAAMVMIWEYWRSPEAGGELPDA